MKAEVLGEPELEFGGGGQHIDPRQGISFYGPADRGATPKQIRVGIIGSQAHIDGLKSWLISCREQITGKDSHLRYLHQPFPGFAPDSPFAAELAFSPRLERPLPKRVLDQLATGNPLTALHEAVNLYDDELAKLADEPNVDVVMVCRPEQLDDAPSPSATSIAAGRSAVRSGPTAPMTAGMDFHSMLKARSLRHGHPIQIVRRGTWDPNFTGKTLSGTGRPRQDPATRAWNLHTALYYKGGNVPWRLPRDARDYSTLYVGTTFYRSIDERELRTSVAQVFNERGDGVIVRGAKAKVDRNDLQPHLSEQDAFELLSTAVTSYYDEHRTSPARIVIHKTSSYTGAELAGFRAAAAEQRLGMLELLWLSNSPVRLFRPGIHPPLRGSMLSLSDDRHILYTRGSVPAYQVYPGMYVPMPLSICMVETESSAHQQGLELLALTKMNWNATPLDGRLPITVRTARSVGDILRHVPEDQRPVGRYAFYM